MWLKRVLQLFIFILISSSSLLTPYSHAAGWYNSNWLYRQKITILPALTDSNLTDFPYLVKITDAANPLFANAQSDHDDILFTKSDGLTKLDHEIEYYESASGNEELVAWVRVESLSATANTEIYMYYGNSSASNQENITGTWNDDYVMVQHLYETSGTHFDATSKNNDGAPANGVVQTATGMVDGADKFDGTNDKVDIADSTTLQVVDMTLEAWVYIPDSIPSNYHGILGHAPSTENWYSLNNNGNRFHFRWSTGSVRRTDFTATIVPNTWYYVVGVLDVTTDKAFTYQNGNLDTTINSPSPPTPTSGPTYIGHSFSGSEFFKGFIDEVRISKTARSEDWIQASFRNQNSPGTYQITGGEEGRTPDIALDCDFNDWNDGDGVEFVVDDEGGADDWASPTKYDITRFGIATNLSDTFYLLFGFDEILPGKTTAAVLIDTDLDDNINFALAVTLENAVSTVQLFTCDNSIPYGCGNQTLSKTYSTPSDYCVGTATGPWNNDSFVEVALPFSDLGSFIGGTSILTSLTSYGKDDLSKPKDTIFADNYDRIAYDTDNGTGQIIDDAGTPVISGTVFSDEGTTSVGVDKTVRLLVNGAVLGTDTTDSDGYYFIVAPVGANDDILVYIDDDATFQGTTVTVFDGVQQDDLDIYAGHVITRHDNGGSLSNAHMFSAKGGATDSDIFYSVSGGTNLAVTGTGTELYVPTGYSYVPGGDVTTPNMENLGTFNGGTGTIDINGTLSMSGGSFTATSGTMSIAGNFVHSGGTFSHNTGTVTLDGTGQSISGSTSFNNLTKTATANDTLTFEAGSTQTIVGAVTLQGAGGNLLNLRSSSIDTPWNFTVNAGATKDISYVDVKDSDASGSDASQKPINPAYSNDSGNTNDWFPPPSLSFPLYLKGDGVPSATLSETAPTATTLPNYDPGRDSDPGLYLQKTGNGLGETDPTKYQMWISSGGGINLNGSVSLIFWSAMKQFDTSNQGIVDAGLYECDPDGSNRTLIAQAQKDVNPWSGGSSTWVEHTISFGDITRTISAGRSLAVKIVVDGNSGDDMWFAYDTTSYPSRLVTAPPPAPDIILLKTVQTFSDPFNGETNPKAIPGAVILYTVTATNQGDGATDADTVFITDPIPANTALFVGDIDGPGPAAGPVLFTDGTPPNDSGLNYTFIAIDDLTDDVAFSIDGTNYDYIPVPDADGFDANITHVRINPKGTFNAASGGDIPTFEVKFKVRVE